MLASPSLSVSSYLNRSVTPIHFPFFSFSRFQSVFPRLSLPAILLCHSCSFCSILLHGLASAFFSCEPAPAYQAVDRRRDQRDAGKMERRLWESTTFAEDLKQILWRRTLPGRKGGRFAVENSPEGSTRYSVQVSANVPGAQCEFCGGFEGCVGVHGERRSESRGMSRQTTSFGPGFDRGEREWKKSQWRNR